MSDRRHPLWFCVLLTLLIGLGSAPARAFSGKERAPAHQPLGHHLDAASLTSGDSLPAPSAIKLAATAVEPAALPIPFVCTERLSIRTLLPPTATAPARHCIRGPPSALA